MKKEKIYNLLLFILIFCTILSIIILKPINNLDELWNYNFAQNVSKGLIPYRDFNMLQMPLLPIICGIIIKCTVNQLIIMRIVAALLCASIVYVIYIIFNKLDIKKELSILFTFLIGYLLKDYYCLDYNYATLFVTLLILYNEIKNYKKDNVFIKYNIKDDLLLGLLAGLTITLKQTSGILIAIALLGNKLLFVKNKKELIIYFKSFIFRLIGIVIPVTIILIYLLCNNAINYFIDYTLKGTSDFTNFVSYKNLIKCNLFGFISILVPISFIYSWCKSIIAEKDKNTYFLLVYGMAMFVIAFPISDNIHFLIASTITLILIIYEIYYMIKALYKKFLVNKKIIKKMLVYILIFISACTILYTIFYETKNISKYINMNNEYSSLKHYEYIPISNRLENQIKEVNNYMLSSNKEIKILDASASIYMIPMDRYNKNYDMLLKGNLGKDSKEELINEIKNSTETQYLVLNEKYSLNWQTPTDIIEYVRENKTKIGEIQTFDIYE